MQRGLAKKRLTEMADYLKEAEDHFFSSLTLVILPLDFEKAKEGQPNNDDDWDYFFARAKADESTPGRSNMGKLHISGQARLFAADGQHRGKAAIMALRENPKLGKESVPVVLLPFEGIDQVRQLFSDLNLNAKPVSKTIGHAYDSRDPFTRLAKAVADTVPIFKNRVELRTNSLPTSSTKVITLNSIVEGTQAILDGLAVKTRMKVEDLVKAPETKDTVIGAWEIIVDAFSDKWTSVLEGKATPGELRDAYIFPHGLGWGALALAMSELLSGKLKPAIKGGKELVVDDWGTTFTDAVTALDWSRGNKVWDGVAMTGDRVNNTRPGKTATRDKVLDEARRLVSEQLQAEQLQAEQPAGAPSA